MKIEIREMHEDEFESSMLIGRESYIQGNIKAQGISYEQAHKQALDEYEKLLPDGFKTKDHMFFTALFDNQFAGYAWVNIKRDHGKVSAWGYDIHVLDKFRRKGVARSIFSKLETLLKEKDVREIKFHVFGDNFRAIPLYESLGYETTNIVMRKEI